MYIIRVYVCIYVCRYVYIGLTRQRLLLDVNLRDELLALELEKEKKKRHI